jgi:hypothetical protein
MDLRFKELPLGGEGLSFLPLVAYWTTPKLGSVGNATARPI